MLKPLNDHVIVKPTSQEEKTASGIILPDTLNKEKPEQGEVISIGPGKMLENGQRSPMSIQVGNKVIFKKYSPDEIKADGQECLVLREEDILAIIE
ncbi:co-chaperone GroES [Candidatus Falkowbacteria bacterium]|jgi:chaperonin GroES|nr:co-chaperone GroES [Candidatus Falkowbacteria bacterium]MBT5503082.1 co-chaperone GroES [Candidatus Falkowbacteria bacterium]MBT6574176.1 co-chaperone GroES [Candidatus Falkowbacteria bacterium]MBT7348677.1 co-chaperone GroES [Candidatus Falkowbacteria bacterium]MBT7500467.1 co-chaperone GroES [Candidatus Falkowbacteria bacterium]